jgi:predicted Zn-dependent peptidase
MPHTRAVCISIFVGVGSRYEAGAEAGISHFIEHLLFKGTDRRPLSRDISAAIEGVGGILNGGTDKELTVYWCKVVQHHLALALDVLGDMLLHSRFDPKEIEKERQVITEEIGMIKDSPSQQVGLLIDEILWPGHPLGRDIAGSRQSVAGITREMLLEYLAGRYLPGNTVVAIAGNIRHPEAVAAVSRALSGWTGGGASPGYTAFQGGGFPRLRVENRDNEQAHLCLALPGLPLLHPQRFVLDLLNVVLGEGMSSRLFAEIRDKLGLAYSVHSYVDHFHDSGSFIIYAGVEPKKLKVATRAILEQLHQLAEVIPEAELTKAKEMSKGRLLLRMEESRSVAGWAGGQEALAGRMLSPDQVVAIIDAVTTGELRQVARDLLVGDRLRLAVVGPISPDEDLEGLLKL